MTASDWALLASVLAMFAGGLVGMMIRIVDRRVAAHETLSDERYAPRDAQTELVVEMRWLREEIHELRKAIKPA